MDITSRENKIVWGIFIASLLLWLRYEFDWNSWFSRKELYNLTGVMAMIPMGIVMLLALRLRIFENLFHGLDKIYYVHKWLGIFSIVFVILHYGVKVGKGFIKQYLGNASVPSDKFALLQSFSGSAKDIGEILVFLFIAMLIITLLKKIPYQLWRHIHRFISVMFVGAAFHTLVLMPARYWHEPVGIALLVLSIAGTCAAIYALLGLIGKHNQYRSKIVEIEHQGDITLVTCQIQGNWHHKAGQYAFLKHQGSGESHPFTIASNDMKDGNVRFAIKALGDYTRKIQTAWHVGDDVRVEGPYARFFYSSSRKENQIWIGAGVGITPFIAWLEALQTEKVKGKVSLYYCVRSEEECLKPEYLYQLTNESDVSLTIYCDERGESLQINSLPFDKDTEVFFCGPTKFAAAIQKSMHQQNLSVPKHFHREYFDML